MQVSSSALSSSAAPNDNTAVLAAIEAVSPKVEKMHLDVAHFVTKKDLDTVAAALQADFQVP